MGHPPIAIDKGEDGPGHEGPEDGLHPESLGQHHEHEQEGEGSSHPDLGRGVLQAHQQIGEPHRVLGATQGEHHGQGQHREGADEDDLRARAGGLTREEERKQQDCPHVGDRGGGEHELADGRVSVSHVLQRRDHHAE